MISLLVAALYNIVDRIFIANAAYLGSDGNAVNTVVFPLTVIALAIAVMIGDGCCAFVSISLGADRRRDAHRGVGNAVVLSAEGGVVLCILYLTFSDEFVAMFGGTVNEKTFAFAKEYFFWIALGIPVYVFGQAMNPVIRSDGSPRFAMVSTVAGAVVNIILDPIFIFVFKWGMMGAAVATVLGQLLTAVMAVYYLCMMPLACVNKAAFIFLQAMGKAVASTALSMIREIVFGVGLVLVLPLVWGLDGVIISMPAADILAFIASAIVIIYTYRTLKKDESKRLA